MYLLSKKIIILIVLIVAFSITSYYWWKGPKVIGYTVENKPLVQTTVASGYITSSSKIKIGSEISGVVVKRHVKEGDQINLGKILLEIKSDELIAQVKQVEEELKNIRNIKRPQSEVELYNAQLKLDQFKREAERRLKAKKNGIISLEDIEKAVQAEKNAQNEYLNAQLNLKAFKIEGVEEEKLKQKLAEVNAQFSKSKIVSQVNGTILSRDVEVGDLIQVGQRLFTVALKGKTEIRVSFDERNIPLLALNQKANIIADAYPDKPFVAHIFFISPTVDAEQGTIEVKLLVDNPPDFLLQDMTVSVNVETAKRDKAIVIPNDSIRNIKRNVGEVLVVRNNKIHNQKIVLGLKGNIFTEVTLGLKLKDKVLASDYNFKEGKRVRFSEQR